MPLEADERLGLVVRADLVERDGVGRRQKALSREPADVLAAAVADETGADRVDEFARVLVAAPFTGHYLA